MNKYIKKAFTVAETMVIMVFIGFIITSEMMIMNGKINQYSASYYNVYNTLKKVAYNIFVDTYKNDGQLPREFPKKVYDTSNHNNLCERFVEYFNIADGASRCSKLNSDNNWIDKKATNINPGGKNREKDNYAFKTANATKFYMDNHKYTYTAKTPDKGKDVTVEYFIIYVDINGDKAPNRVNKKDSDKVLPDIVPFAITRTGEVIPMGYPIYSRDYMTAKVRYSVKLDEDLNKIEIAPEEQNKIYSSSATFNEAIHTAWGKDKKAGSDDFLSDSEIPFSFRLTQQLMEKTPENEAIKFFKDTLPENPKWDKRCCDLDDATKKCKNNSALTYDCNVIIDDSDQVRN